MLQDGAQRMSKGHENTTSTRHEVDAIVLKGLSKEPERRYSSASAMVDDIQRLRDGRPVLAAPDSAFYQLRKFVRRNRASVAVGAAMIVLLAGASLRERTLRAAHACFSHRLMMDRIVPGGVTDDLGEGGIDALRALLETVRTSFPGVVELYDNTASLQDRTVTTGYLAPTLARAFGAGGYVGRASGRAFDARKAVGYAPYDQLEFEAPVRDDGDVNARVWIRIREVEQSLRLIDQILERLPEGRIHTDRAKSGGTREGLALVEAFRGDVLIYVRIGEDGLIERCHMRDASWFQWPLLEVAIEGNIVADFPLCNKSFNCSYSGHDL